MIDVKNGTISGREVTNFTNRNDDTALKQGLCFFFSTVYFYANQNEI